MVREASTWTSKQRDFFNGERRFIFGVANQEVAQKWINSINKAVQEFQQPESLSARREAYIAASQIEDSILDQKKAIEELTEIYQQNEQEQMAFGPSPSE